MRITWDGKNLRLAGAVCALVRDLHAIRHHLARALPSVAARLSALLCLLGLLALPWSLRAEASAFGSWSLLTLGLPALALLVLQPLRCLGWIWSALASVAAPGHDRRRSDRAMPRSARLRGAALHGLDTRVASALRLLRRRPWPASHAS